MIYRCFDSKENQSFRKKNNRLNLQSNHDELSWEVPSVKCNVQIKHNTLRPKRKKSIGKRQIFKVCEPCSHGIFKYFEVFAKQPRHYFAFRIWSRMSVIYNGLKTDVTVEQTLKLVILLFSNCQPITSDRRLYFNAIKWH